MAISDVFPVCDWPVMMLTSPGRNGTTRLAPLRP
jgi:hypothetical protein